MSTAIAERAAAIRNFKREHPDQAFVRRYALLAARWEELRLRMHYGKTTPADDARFREVGDMLRALTRSDRITGSDGFLPGDPQRILGDSWVESARLWFP